MSKRRILALGSVLTMAIVTVAVASASGFGSFEKGPAHGKLWHPGHACSRPAINVQLGPRPFYLVDDMDPGPLKYQLKQCAEGPFEKSDFSIGHRGAALQFPEHTKESYMAAARMGAGLDIITWTLERSGLLRNGGGYYYQSISEVINNDGDMLNMLDVLAMDVGIIGIFSDWPATVTYYANCMGL